MRHEIIPSMILKYINTCQIVRFQLENEIKPDGCNNPLRIASNCALVDDDGITNVESDTEYLQRRKVK